MDNDKGTYGIIPIVPKEVERYFNLIERYFNLNNCQWEIIEQEERTFTTRSHLINRNSRSETTRIAAKYQAVFSQKGDTAWLRSTPNRFKYLVAQIFGLL